MLFSLKNPATLFAIRMIALTVLVVSFVSNYGQYESLLANSIAFMAYVCVISKIFADLLVSYILFKEHLMRHTITTSKGA